MATFKTIPREEAMQTRTKRQPGIRRQRMNTFDTYVQTVKDAAPEEAVVFEELGESGQKFVLSLRGAFNRAGLKNVTVRKMRGKDEVRVWRSDVSEAEPEPTVIRKKRAARPKAAAAATSEPERELAGVSS